MADVLLLERTNGVATLTLNRPEVKNAIDKALLSALPEAFAEIDADAGVRVVVITGAGENFCSGAQLEAIDRAGSGKVHPYLMMDRGQPVGLALHRLRVPTIARVDGLAIGMGMMLALHCDLIVASDRARFCTMYSRRALSPDFGGTWLLPRLIGLHRAKELALLAEMVSAADAERIGFVNRVVAVGDLDAFVGGWAATIAAGPPLALAQTKRMLDEAAMHGLEQALDAETRAQTVNLMGADVAEAFAAFAERRDPDYPGYR